MSTAPNANSTCEWVDEAYARRLWGQLLRGRFPNRASLLTVRLGAEIIEDRSSMGGRRRWIAKCFGVGPGEALDLLLVYYDPRGLRLSERTVLRITQHAGRRMFMRLRTNAPEDVLQTSAAALNRLVHDTDLPVPWKVEPGAECSLALSWGHFPLVADGGVWVAKTFIPSLLSAQETSS